MYELELQLVASSKNRKPKSMHSVKENPKDILKDMRSIIPCPRAHFQSQTPADAETGSSGGKPEIYRPLERKGPV